MQELDKKKNGAKHPAKKEKDDASEKKEQGEMQDRENEGEADRDNYEEPQRDQDQSSGRFDPIPKEQGIH